MWKNKYLKILVVGDSGLGKTTLIQTLLSKPGENLQVQDGTNTPLPQFMKDPESLCTRLTWKDDDDKITYVYRMQDTPGYGDDPDISNHIKMMMSFLQRQNTKWLETESARDRCVDLRELEDPRVDLCLYALPPHRMRSNDVRYMAELSKLVPVVPVIMKADTMTIHEAQVFRQEVHARLNNPGVPGIRGKIPVFSFSPQAMERAGMPSGAACNCPPFVVIASNDINQGMLHGEVPMYWPERAYKWGTAEAYNPEHSDLLALRALLMSEAVEEVSHEKVLRYEKWRKKHLHVPFLRRVRRTVLRLAMGSVLPGAVVVFGACHDWDTSRMAGTVKSAGSKLKDKVGRQKA